MAEFEDYIKQARNAEAERRAKAVAESIAKALNEKIEQEKRTNKQKL